MAKTYENLVFESRELLQDTLEPYRWSDSYFLNTLNRAMQMLGAIRPDAFYDYYRANALNIPIIVDSDAPADGEVDWGDAFGVDMMFYTPMMAFIIGSIELTEDEFAVDGRAMALLGQFRLGVIGDGNG